MRMHVYNDKDELSKNIDFTGKDIYVLPYGGNTVPYCTNKISEKL